MGAIFSTPSPNPSAPMPSSESSSSSSSSSPNLQSTDQASKPPTEKTQKVESQKPIESEEKPNKVEDQKKPIESQDGESNKPGEAEEEEEGECGFCLYMKGGGCKDAFIAWEDCIKETEDKKEDIVEKCFNVTSALKTCMEAHSDYYEPLLQAEKEAEADAVKELEEEKAREAAGSSPPSSESRDSSGSKEEESKS